MQLEREQRFLLARVPVDVDEPRLIEDRYITGTRLRLRRVSAGNDVIFKLAQKVRLDEEDPSVVAITNIYLDAGEYARLVVLPGTDLVKTRYTLATSNGLLAVDDYHDQLDGLVLAEIELSPQAPPLVVPEFAVADVSHDARFSGGHLAHVNASGLRQLLAEFGQTTRSNRKSPE